MDEDEEAWIYDNESEVWIERALPDSKSEAGLNSCPPSHQMLEEWSSTSGTLEYIDEREAALCSERVQDDIKKALQHGVKCGVQENLARLG